MYLSAIVLAAGRGARFGKKTSKPLVKVNLKPIILYSLKALSQQPEVKDIVLVVNASNRKAIVDLVKKNKLLKVSKIITGGLRRQDSVYNALKVLDRLTELVLIHDSARPFIDKKVTSSVIEEAQKTGAAIVGTPVKATIKQIREAGVSDKGYVVEKTIDRSNLWEAQTPQVFRKGLILMAYQRFNDLDVTDDASLIEKLGIPVSIVKGSYFNIKITTPEDLILAEAIARKYRDKGKGR